MALKPFGIVEYKAPIESPDEFPREPFPYYVLAYEGLYTRGVNTLGRYLVPTKRIDRLDAFGQDKNGLFWYDATRIPAHIMAQMVDFFRHVWETIHSEAELLLFYNDEEPDENERWRLFCPKQVVSGGSVHSDYTDQMDEFPEGYQLVGTTHSHCNFGSTHSGIDDRDAKDFNGVHITVGYVNREQPDFDCFVSVGGINFPMNGRRFTEKVANIEDINGYKAPVDEWMKVVEKDAPPPAKEVVSSSYPTHHQSSGMWMSGSYNSKTHWSKDFRRNVPDDLWDDKTHELSDMGFMVIMAEVLEELRELALVRSMDLGWQIFDPLLGQVDQGGPKSEAEFLNGDENVEVEAAIRQQLIEDNPDKDLPASAVSDEDDKDEDEFWNRAARAGEPDAFLAPVTTTTTPPVSTSVTTTVLPEVEIIKTADEKPKRRGRFSFH